MSKQIETQFRNAAIALQHGDALTAKQGFLKVTRKLPNSVSAWYNLGLSYQHLDKHREAIPAYKKAVALDPRNIEALINLGLAQKHSGDTESARFSADRSLALDSRHPRALNLIGTLEAEQGNHEAARGHFEQALKSQPGNPDACINLANLYLESGGYEAADRIDPEFLEHLPDNKHGQLVKARVFIKQRTFDAAASIIARLKGEHPNDEEVLRTDLELREAIRDHFGAIDVANELAKIAPNDGAVWNSLGSAYFQLDSIDQAKSHYQKAIELDPDNSEFQNNMGLACSSLGDEEAAGRYYRRALELNPGNGEAYRNIATMTRYTSRSDPDILAVEKLWNEATKDNLHRIKLAFALGKMYDDCGAHDEAFAVYNIGNELKFRETYIDLDQYFAHIDRIGSVLTERPAVTANRTGGPQPIFILGMPRSGTTLVEQILSRHPDVLGCGELPCIERAIMHMEKRVQPMRVYPDDFKSIQSDELTEHAKSYIEWVSRLHDLNRPFLTDKMPFNFVHIWLIKALFPESAIVHCRRHPLDVMVSNYFQLYGSEVTFVYDLKSLAEYIVRYFRITRHWKRMFGDEITDVSYEMLVNDSEPQTRRLIDAIGLTWNDACLDPRRSASPVRTASVWQVRQGIYTQSRERWRKYESHLGDAIEILVRERVLDGETLQPLDETG